MSCQKHLCWYIFKLKLWIKYFLRVVCKWRSIEKTLSALLVNKINIHSYSVGHHCDTLVSPSSFCEIFDLQKQLVELGRLKTHRDIQDFHCSLDYSRRPSQLQRSLKTVREKSYVSFCCLETPLRWWERAPPSGFVHLPSKKTFFVLTLQWCGASVQLNQSQSPPQQETRMTFATPGPQQLNYY